MSETVIYVTLLTCRDCGELLPYEAVRPICRKCEEEAEDALWEAWILRQEQSP